MSVFEMKLNPFDSALLSEACYIYFERKSDGSYVEREVIDALKEKSFSSAQAEDFVSRWEVVYQEPNTASGFSATLFRSKGPNAAQPWWSCV